MLGSIIRISRRQTTQRGKLMPLMQILCNSFCSTTNFSQNIEEKLLSMHGRYTEIGQKLASPELTPDQIMSLSKEFSQLTTIVELIEQRNSLTDSLNEITNLEKELNNNKDDDHDQEMKDMVEMERAQAIENKNTIELNIMDNLTPRDEADDRSIVLEVRAGTGGQEASLFAGELFKMYNKFALLQGWKWEELSVSKTDIGGFKEAQASVIGEDVFKNLKFESGTHRVQRVPVNDTKLQTSAASVLVLAEVQDVEVEIRPQDLRIDVFRSSGAGGQSVNTTESAVRMTHLPTGIVVSMQDERSQIQNRARALKYIRARVYDYERRKAEEAASELRTSVAGTGSRSDKVRTYNFPQDRITDHRVNLSITGIERMISIGDGLNDIIESLQEKDKKERLEAFLISLNTADNNEKGNNSKR
jgi:peptide chain release factor 1